MENHSGRRCLPSGLHDGPNGFSEELASSLLLQLTVFARKPCCAKGAESQQQTQRIPGSPASGKTNVFQQCPSLESTCWAGIAGCAECEGPVWRPLLGPPAASLPPNPKGSMTSCFPFVVLQQGLTQSPAPRRFSHLPLLSDWPSLELENSSSSY